MNDLCLEVVLRSLRHIRHWISRKPLETDTSFQRTTNRKWSMGNRMVTWPMTSRDPKGQTRNHNTLRAQYLENSWRCYLATIAILDSLLWNSTVGYPSDRLDACYQHVGLLKTYNAPVMKYLCYKYSKCYAKMQSCDQSNVENRPIKSGGKQTSKLLWEDRTALLYWYYLNVSIGVATFLEQSICNVFPILFWYSVITSMEKLSMEKNGHGKTSNGKLVYGNWSIEF